MQYKNLRFPPWRYYGALFINLLQIPQQISTTRKQQWRFLLSNLLTLWFVALWFIKISHPLTFTYLRSKIVNWSNWPRCVNPVSETVQQYLLYNSLPQVEAHRIWCPRSAIERFLNSVVTDFKIPNWLTHIIILSFLRSHPPKSTSLIAVYKLFYHK